ncbi:hypothetical protein MRB53_032188 [Persea americana]|uniref:Uncharacterized protein n=2 Tax=Persea americana TaxID=3435 RepID=A0ACC2KRF2_PERAE|nr:hypothetical protein MRB53_032177 [Persea americana]KAJ8623658.1 hypothetical protein MRB53_032188 [Persea americana]
MAMIKTYLRNPTPALKHVLDMLQRTLSLPQSLPGRAPVPKDVKEGHFAVLTMDDGCAKRFVIALRYLNHPEFQKLLEQAAEEFGFNQEGALAVPCRASELERILGDQWK